MNDFYQKFENNQQVVHAVTTTTEFLHSSTIVQVTRHTTHSWDGHILHERMQRMSFSPCLPS